MVTGVVVRNMRRFRGTGRGHWGAGVVVSRGIFKYKDPRWGGHSPQ